MAVAASPDNAFSGEDRRHMAAALRLARRGLGRTGPNPAVGCIITRDNRIVGRGWTQPGGRPHAETQALAAAGAAAQTATAYVTLEPCCHQGQTGPCTEALIAAGISRVVAATSDPDPRMSGAGFAALQNAGVAVAWGLLQAQADALNAGFRQRILQQRPFVSLKIASTLDGHVATAIGDSQWITGQTARAHGHLLRAQNDAILVGIGTVLTDNPSLTCRLPGLSYASPVRIVADRGARLPLQSQLVQSAGRPATWLLTAASPDSAAAAALSAAGVTCLPVAANDDRGIDLNAAMVALADRGINRLLVEGGPQLATAFVAAGLVDQLYWYRAPRLIGDDGRAALEGFGFAQLKEAIRLRPDQQRKLDQDLLEIFAVEQ